MSKAVLFSSATYAKTAAVFGLYVVKTVLRTAVPSLEIIFSALKVGGENVAEYIASGLVAEGQMIRRDRSFGDCKKVTEIVGKSREKDVIGDVVYEKLTEDNQREIYNKAIGYFKELRDYAKSFDYRAAVFSCTAKILANENIQLADQDVYEQYLAESKISTRFISSDRCKEFIAQNMNKWVISDYDLDGISRYKMTFRENLFLAIKTKFASEKLVECLTTEEEYTNLDGKVHVSPLKPVLAIRNTGEAMFSDLYLDINSEIENDFSTYLKVIYNKLFRGTLVLRKVNNSLFGVKKTLKADDEWRDSWERALEYTVANEDFPDDGFYINNLQSRLNEYQSELPFSPIDTLREDVESVKRPPIYFNADGTAKYGLARSENFVFSEVTSRKYMLKKQDGRWYFQKNNRIDDTSTAFSNFNNGKSDILLINQVGSTGGSAQSSPSEGLDTRPRNMFIIQFELDINMEVQKRGRINRTGQLNSPTYTYIITQIPVEIRTYLMFRNKLRKLDANTSADQTASKENSEIRDDKNDIIQDIFNQYGFGVFLNGFLNQPIHRLYYELFNELRGNSSKKDDAEKIEADVSKFITFTNELELYPTDTDFKEDKQSNEIQYIPITQEYFFNYMNQAYKEKIELLISLNQYQLEIETKNYKASLRERVVVKLNSGTTVFSSPLFLADYYTLDDKVMYSKDKMEAKANSLSVNSQGENIPYEDFRSNLISEIDDERTEILDKFDSKNEKNRPKKKKDDSDEAYEVALKKWNIINDENRVKEGKEYDDLIDYILFFTTMKPVIFEGILGRFIGFKIKKSNTKRKFSLSHIEFYFCFLERYPLLKLSLSNNAEASIIDKIKQDTTVTLNLRYEFAQSYIKRIENWTPDVHKRIIRRLYSGNILGGIIEANQQKGKIVDIEKLDVDKDGKEISFNVQRQICSWELVRFSNIDGSKTTAVEIGYDNRLPDNISLDRENQVLKVSSGNEDIKKYINLLPNIGYVTYNRDIVNWVGDYEVNNSYDLDFRRVIWNTFDDKKRYNSRSVCIFKKDDLAVIQIIQPYKIIAKTGLDEDYKETSELYNPIFYDAAMLNTYNSYMTEQSKKILYAIRTKREKDNEDTKKKKDEDRVDTVTSIFAELNIAQISSSGGNENTVTANPTGQKFNKVLAARIKTFTFSFDDNNLVSLLNQLYDKYDMNFNFRSGSDEYWMIEAQVDSYSKEGTDVIAIEYPVGEYTYRFDDKYIGADKIPNYIKKIDLGTYGGVVLSQPISPTFLRSYNLKPYKIPTDILIKLAFSSMKDDAKTMFLKKIKEYLDKSDYDMGNFIMEFLNEKTGTSTTYFFGNKTIPELGKMFKSFALNEKLEDYVLEEKQTSDRKLKNKVTFADAEDFLMLMLQ